MADENNDIQQQQTADTEEQSQQQQGLQFEDILPVVPQGSMSSKTG